MPPSREEKISRHGNLLRVRTKIRASDMRYFAFVLYKTIEGSGYKDVTLDFTQCDFMVESCMLPIMPLLAQYREKQNVDFKFLSPEDDEIRRLFQNTNWAHFIEPQRNKQAEEFEGGHVPAIRFSDTKTQYDAVSRIMNLMFGWANLERKQFDALLWALQEITDNVLQHAESNVGGFVQATKYENSVEFVVADAGIGIPNSLGRRKRGDQAQALRYAVSEGGRRDEEQGAGNGLYGCRQLAKKSQGFLAIHSIHAWLNESSDQDLKTGESGILYNGTAIVCRIGFGNPKLLEEALVFEGKRHIPLVDYVESEYETGKDGEMILKIKDHEPKLGSRIGGKDVHTILRNLLREVEKGTAQKVVVDFSDVSVISSSFADEVFGRLYVELGPYYERWLEFLHMDSTIAHLIERAVLQRWGIDKERNQRRDKNDKDASSG